MRDVIWLAVVFIVISSTSSICQFPREVLTNDSRDWKGRVREQNTGQSWDISFDGDTMTASARDNLVRSYTRVCLTNRGDNKYVVSHQNENEDSPTYLCMQVGQ